MLKQVVKILFKELFFLIPEVNILTTEIYNRQL
jgi:hypothetical protein